MFVSAIIVAGGRGTRVGAGEPKQMLDIGGRSMIQRSIDAFDRHPSVDEIVVVLPAGGDSFAAGIEATRELRFAFGGVRRQDSVSNGFLESSASADIVLVHDAARPFVSEALISRVIEGASAHGAVIPARQASDTIKRAPAAGAAIVETIPRETIWLAQTPQGFRRGVLADAIAKGGSADVTDEAMLAERAGHPVHVVEGDEGNVKITTAADLERARAKLFPVDYSRLNEPGIINREEFPRVGSGYDLHRLEAGRTLVLAGVTIPFDKGPVSHSDGDVVAHALCDAMFGAAAMGDIGRHFPNNDPRWKDAGGLDLLARSAALLGDAGWKVVSADVTIVLERPKLSPFVDEIRASLAATLGIDSSAIGVKAKTNEGVDAVGRGEAIAAHAVAVIR